MRVMVTGGSGFIGSAVCRELDRRGHEVTVFDKKDGDIRYADDFWRVGADGIDHVIHLAGVLGTHELFDTPYLAVDVNIIGTLNALEFCRHHGAGYTGITMPQVFPSLYTATKMGATGMASAYQDSHGVAVSHVRAFNAFGPGQAHGPGHPQKIIPTFAHNFWHGLPLPVWGDGNQTVDLIHVRDLARMLVDAMSFGNDEVFDGGTGMPFTVNEVVKMVSATDLSQAYSVDYLPMRRGERPTNIVAEGENWDLLDWTPTFHVKDLWETVQSYK